MHQDTVPWDVIPRDLRFEIAQHGERAWFGGDPVKSAIVDGLGVLFPTGERFLNRSLLYHAKSMTDPAILAGIKGFVAQEAFHTREHEVYNTALRAQGVNVDTMEERFRLLLARFESPLDRLAATCALEEITSNLSRMCLRREALWNQAAPAYRRLWRWHALEEIEHSSVALDVLHALPHSGPPWKRYLLRVKHLMLAATYVTSAAIRNAADILRGEDERLPARLRLRLAWALLASPGFLTAQIIPLLSYLRPGYRGGTKGDERLVQAGRRLLDEDRAPG